MTSTLPSELLRCRAPSAPLLPGRRQEADAPPTGPVPSMNEPPAFLDLQPVAKRSVCIVSPARGVHELLPIVFDERHLALVKLSAHSVLLGFTSGVCRSSKSRPGDQPRSPQPTARGSDFEMEQQEEEPREPARGVFPPHLQIPELQQASAGMPNLRPQGLQSRALRT